MSSYNPMNNPSNNSNSGFLASSVENKGLFNKLLKNLSNFGMKYDDMIIRNQVGVGQNEDPMAQKNNTMYDFFSQRAVAAVLNKKSIPYLDKAYADKKRILREYSIKDEIRDMVSRISDECIIYNDKDFCSIKSLSNDYSKDVQDKYQEYFEKIYNKHGFADGLSAWNLMKDFLIDGYITMEIVWDDKKKNIIHFNQLAANTVVPAYEPSIGNLWIQYPEDPQLRRIFLDSQLIHISYSRQNDYMETSYVEGLIKPYNQLKIIEQTRIMFNIINASVYQKFTIPIGGLPRQRAEEQVGQLIHDYSEEVEWDDNLGTISINGSKHLMLNKQIWFPVGEAGTPNMELVSPSSVNLNESDMLTWFYNALKRASKIPFQRFEKENGGGNMISDASEMTRDEQTFSNFTNRIRSNFKELIVKPLKLQICMEFPELIEDEVFLNQVDIVFNSNHLFEEWKRLSNLSKRADILERMAAIQVGDKPYFHIEYLMDSIMKLTQEEKDENQKYWTMMPNVGGGTSEGGGDLGGGAPGGGEPGGDFGGEPGGVQGEPGGEPGGEPVQPGGVQGEPGGDDDFEF